MKTKNTMLFCMVYFWATSLSHALTSVEDSELSQVYGQDGVTITIKVPDQNNLWVRYFDRDGIPGYSAAGLQLSPMKIKFPASGIKMDMDVGFWDYKGQGTFQIVTSVGNAGENTTISTGDLTIGKATCAGTPSVCTGGISNPSIVVIPSFDITFGPISIVTSLGYGSGATGNMIDINTSFANGLAINNLQINQEDLTVVTQVNGSVKFGSVVITNADNPTTLGLKAGINFTNSGMVFNISQLGSSSAGFNVSLRDISVGTVSTASKIGQIDIGGLNFNGATLTLIGH